MTDHVTSGHLRPSVIFIGLRPPLVVVAQPGHALDAAAGPARAEPGPAAPAGADGPGQPGGMRYQLELAVIAGNRDNGADPAARQRKPLPRPVVCRRAARSGTHNPIFAGKAGRSSPAILGSPSRDAVARVATIGDSAECRRGRTAMGELWWRPPTTHFCVLGAKQPGPLRVGPARNLLIFHGSTGFDWLDRGTRGPPRSPALVRGVPTWTFSRRFSAEKASSSPSTF